MDDGDKRTNLIIRCKKYIELCNKYGWAKVDPAEKLALRDMETLLEGLEAGKPFIVGNYDNSRSQVIGMDGCIFWVLLLEELERIEKDETKPNPYGHHHAFWRRDKE